MPGRLPIKHIYGSGEDFIAFVNEVDQPVVFSERNDEVFEKAGAIARKISADAFRKLNKAHLNDVNDHIHGCLVRALAKDFSIEKVEEEFEPALRFIKSLETTKRVLARGPNPQHIVYITNLNRVAWEVKEIPPHCNDLLASLDRLKQLSLTLLPPKLRETVAVSIGTAASSIIRSDPKDDFANLVDEAERTLTSKVAEFSYLIYAVSSLIIASVAVLILEYFQMPEEIVRIAIYGGITGSLLSALQRTKSANFSLYESKESIVAQATLRILIGAISGFIIKIMADAGVALTMLAESHSKVFLAGLIAGFVERLIPDLLTSLSKNSENSA